MIANYHTHTIRCNHASGTEEEYIRCALEAGMRTLGFSDHTPYCFPGDYYSTFRMRPELLPEYAATIRRLAGEYRDRLRILLGVECEYYPKHFSDTLALLRDNGVEYLILGQHFPGNEYDRIYGGRRTSQEEDLRDYCHQAMEAMNTGLFTYFAHPELIHFQGEEKIYRQHMRQVCREARSCSVPLEINLMGIREGKWYPNRIFMEIAAEEGCQMVLGCDAHSPAALKIPDIEKKALDMAAEFDLTVLPEVEIRSIL